jgi:hypothetical protein
MRDMWHSARTITAIAAAVGFAVFSGAGGALAAETQMAVGAHVAASGGTWGTAEEVPGTAALGGGGGLTSVSCATAGNCSAVGEFANEIGDQESFVANEVDGTWQNAEQVPGASALGPAMTVTSVSCATAGNCSAGGKSRTAFVVNEVNGTWQDAIDVPGIAKPGQIAQVQSVSCGAAGDCSAGGYYYNTSGSSSTEQAFIANEVNGKWYAAQEVPGTATLNTGGQATTLSVSCASAGNCSAGGQYAVGSGVDFQAFVANEVDGKWHDAIEVPGTATLNQNNTAETASVSCGSAGNCSAGGYYYDSSGHRQAFVANEVNGTWHNAIEVPGTPALNQDGKAQTASVSCATAGNCSAGGSYIASSGVQQVFVASEVDGTWQKAIEVPGIAALNSGGKNSPGAEITSLSCATAGNCSTGGSYYSTAGERAFVVSQVNGTWQTAIRVTGLLNGASQTASVSCGAAGNCSAGGSYDDNDGNVQAFVVNETT